jgi:hypothetical protein
MLTFDFDALKAKLDVSAFVFDTQLKSVDFPMFGKPTMPHFRAMFFVYYFFESAKVR